ncbi:hypothetical protein IAQ61_002243 [Plenodomus lingam]|uniref:uncharacterized protein n=1 Tax=Leptosphaeria maculans TaxID=5022 RepID=UPI0033188820|nr:hypothetical protein IAQ61_002243 [Plenodomus lingam]
MQNKKVSQHEAAAKADDNSPSIWSRMLCSADTSHEQSAASRGHLLFCHSRDAVEINDWMPEPPGNSVEITTPRLSVITVQCLYAGYSSSVHRPDNVRASFQAGVGAL